MRYAKRLGSRRRGVVVSVAAGLMVVLVSCWLAAGGTLAPAGGTPVIAGEPTAGEPTGGALGPIAGEPIAGEPTGGASDPTEAASAPFAVTTPDQGDPDDASAAGSKPVERSEGPGDAPSTGIMAAPGPETAPRMAPQMSKIAPPTPAPTAPPVPVDVAPDRSIVRTARLGLTVADLPAVSATVRDAATSVGGYVASENAQDKSATFTLRVPSARLDEVMGRLASIGTVTERYGQAEDVTDQMVDVQSRLATQQASVARMRALLARATTVGEVVSVESELTAREADLESLQRRLASVSGRVELSTLTVSLVPVPVAAPQPSDSGFLAGLAVGWRTFVAAASGALTVLGAVLPFLVAIAVAVAVVLLGRRALRRHRAAAAALAAVSAGEDAK